MSGERRTMPRFAPRVVLLAIAATLLCFGLVAVLLWLLPPALTNLSAQVEDADTQVEVGRANITVPAGWVVRRPAFQSDTVLITAPDGCFDITVTASGDAPADALTEAKRTGGSRIVEVLRSGLTAAHEQVDDDTVAVAVGDDHGSAMMIATSEEGIDGYLAELSGVIEGTQLSAEEG